MNNKKPIAIVGLSGIFPGADNINKYWKNIINNVSAIDNVPAHRWIINPESVLSSVVKPDKVLSGKAGLINNFKFDSSGFNISKELLNQLDPMYHLALSTGRDAIEGCFVNDEIKKRTGVILAAIALPTDTSSKLTRLISGKNFEQAVFGKHFIKEPLKISKEIILASRVTGLPASILAKSLNLKGGSYTLDAACSSSLYAIKLACDELNSNRCDLMLAGGVSRPESLFTQTGFSQLTALSPSGICAPFDKSADGLVVGEGAGIIVLKRLDDAMSAGDTIHGLLYGAGLTNDIGGNLLAPDTKGQVRAMELAYKNAAWSPFDIDHVECHGTGTPVGDSIELKSLKTLWGKSGWEKNQCAIGSVKSMIGHLLTAAGIAGTIKTILALKNKTIPPSLNFNQPVPDSPLENGPFYVPTKAKEWKKEPDKARRAAMSAFGFGGTNAHLLIEEWNKNKGKSYFVSESIKSEKKCSVAITGIGTYLGSITRLTDFQETVFNGKINTSKNAPGQKWKNSEEPAQELLNIKKLPLGNYIENFNVSIGEFHIPPNEMPDILPQHLLMLKATSNAISDANIQKRKEKPRMGVAIGMNFDFEANNFHLRWNMENEVEKWNSLYRLDLNNSHDRISQQNMKVSPPRSKDLVDFHIKSEKSKWIDDLKDAVCPPLSPARTTGALGGIIASRIAKEFKLGGPSFIVSSEETSGLKALEIGMHSIQNNESDTFIAGAVDLPGEIRRLIAYQSLNPFSDTNTISPFDKNANGSLPGEGAVAVVLKNLDEAIKDGDRIYAVLKGTGSASSGGIDEAISEEAYTISLDNAVKNAAVSPFAINYIETHGSASPVEDNIEISAINKYFTTSVQDQTRDKKHPIAIGSLMPSIGHTGAVSGLASLIKASLCLYQKVLPPLVNYQNSGENKFNNELFHLPVFPQYWMRDSINNPRTACVSSMTSDGNCVHVILEEMVEDTETADNTEKYALEMGKRIDINRPEILRKLDNTSKKIKSQLLPIDQTLTGINKVISIIDGNKKTIPPSIPLKKTINKITSKQNTIEKAQTRSVLKHVKRSSEFKSKSDLPENSNIKPIADLIEPFTKNFEKTAEAHKKFIEFSKNLTKSFADTINLQTSLIEKALQTNDQKLLSEIYIKDPFKSNGEIQKKINEPQHQYHTASDILAPVAVEKKLKPEPAFPRNMCMEFAIGSIEKVLGPQFRIVDSYDVRVRLPNEPLMLVDRILSVEGKIASLSSGKIVTEHDVHHDAWYLDGGKAPVCISIEAGQADLFLCSYLGIDLAVKGKRSYRLLDAVAQFHGGLPQAGETIRYEIEVERFINQGETYLFFFNFKGFIGKKHIISMRDGCAGFFTQKEVKESGGIVLTKEETQALPGIKTPLWKDLVDFFGSNKKYNYDDDKINALRNGDAEKAFGPHFKGKKISNSLAIPGGRMKLVDRVLSLDPKGGRYGLGSIRAQADIHPDAWFLKCHFVDDMVMPGTLMFECCMHTLRIFTMRMGWISDREDVCCEPVPNVQSFLKCRGPVTVETKHVFYLIEIKEIGYNPEPFVIADAHMYAHDEHIVMFKDMSMKLSGITKDEIENYWKE